MSGARELFDATIKRFGVIKMRLAHNERIVENIAFELEIVKVHRWEEDDLST